MVAKVIAKFNINESIDRLTLSNTLSLNRAVNLQEERVLSAVPPASVPLCLWTQPTPASAKTRLKASA